ncbi:spherulation-specific family 4 protein [Caballeronia sp. SL2Y3]|uniref:spherulation-specific family 4 protein n=1 Tax=Caballeronia sp. SL2Y3 TaxID=2878151 RepID=UPI00351D9DEC
MQFNRAFLKLGAALAAAMLSSAASAAGTTDGASTSLSLVVPSYFYPTKSAADWNSLAASASRVSTTAILNPNSGPGTSADANYAAAIAKLHAAGGKVIGYVSTSYAGRPLSAVVADINMYVSLYNVDGFFIDEMTADCQTSHVQFYQSVYNYIKGLKATYSVMGNPGTTIPEVYASLPTADQFVVFEGNAKNYAKFQPASWQAAYPKSRFVHIVYNASAAQMPGVLAYARTHGAGGVYVTSLTLPNPYKGLPACWNDEVTNAAAQ